MHGNGESRYEDRRIGRPIHTALVLLVTFILFPHPDRAQGPRSDEVNLPLADYLELVRAARENQENRPAAPGGTTVLSAQRVSLRLDGDIAHLLTRLEIDARGRGGVPVLLPIAGRIESAKVEAKGSSKLYRTTSGDLAFVPQETGRFVATVGSRIRREPETEAFVITTRAGVSPVSEVELDLPSGVTWEMDGAVTLEERTEGGRRHLRLAPPLAPGAGSEGVGIVTIRTVAAPLMATAPAVARSVVITHLDLRADEVFRLDTVLVEVLRGEIAKLEARLPAGLAVERAWMDDGTELAVSGTSSQGMVLEAPRKKRLSGSGFLKILSRRTGPPPEDFALEFVEPTIAVRARYLVVSSSVVATLAAEPKSAWSTIDLTDPPDSIEAELAERPPVGGWRLEGPSAGSRPALRIGVLSAVDRSPLPIADRSTTTFVNPDGSLLIQDRFLLLDHREVLELSLPEGLRFESATVEGDVVRPIERNGKHLLPLRYRDAPTTTIEISLTDRSLVAAKRAARRTFALPELEAGPGGEVLRHAWTLHLPPGLSARLTGGTLRPIPKASPATKRKDGGKADAGYFDFGAYEEMSDDETRQDGSRPIATSGTVKTEERDKNSDQRNPWAVLQKTPGVLTDRINVGGNESGQQSSSLNRAGTAIEVRPSFEPPPGGSEMRLSGALPPRRVTAEIEVKEAKRR